MPNTNTEMQFADQTVNKPGTLIQVVCICKSVWLHPMELLTALQKVEDRGAIGTADRVLMLARQVWDYWLPTAHVQQRNITEGLKGAVDALPG